MSKIEKNSAIIDKGPNPITKTIRNESTDVGDIISDMAIDHYNPKFVTPSKIHGVIYGVKTEGDYSHPMSDFNRNLNEDPIQYHILPQGQMGSIFPEPPSFGDTNESRMLINCLPVFTPSRVGIENLEVGASVQCGFYDSTMQVGVIDHNYTSAPQGQASKGSGASEKPSKAFKDSKAPSENG